MTELWRIEHDGSDEVTLVLSPEQARWLGHRLAGPGTRQDWSQALFDAAREAEQNAPGGETLGNEEQPPTRSEHHRRNAGTAARRMRARAAMVHDGESPRGVWRLLLLEGADHLDAARAMLREVLLVLGGGRAAEFEKSERGELAAERMQRLYDRVRLEVGRADDPVDEGDEIRSSAGHTFKPGRWFSASQDESAGVVRNAVTAGMRHYVQKFGSLPKDHALLLLDVLEGREPYDVNVRDLLPTFQADRGEIRFEPHGDIQGASLDATFVDEVKDEQPACDVQTLLQEVDTTLGPLRIADFDQASERGRAAASAVEQLWQRVHGAVQIETGYPPPEDVPSAPKDTLPWCDICQLYVVDGEHEHTVIEREMHEVHKRQSVGIQNEVARLKILDEIGRDVKELRTLIEPLLKERLSHGVVPPRPVQVGIEFTVDVEPEDVHEAAQRLTTEVLTGWRSMPDEGDVLDLGGKQFVVTDRDVTGRTWRMTLAPQSQETEPTVG